MPSNKTQRGALWATLTNLTKAVDTIHYYRPRWAGFDAHCRLRIWHDPQCTYFVVMFTELPDNKGISVTNYSENLATEIRRIYGLDSDTTWWIEHYPPSQLRKRFAQKEFDQITYTWHNGEADNPHWQRLDPTHLQTLIRE